MPRQQDRTSSFLHIGVLLIACAFVLPGAGCAPAQYYRISDPQTDQIYYTQKIDHPQDMPNTAKFVDVRTGQTVTLERMKVDALSKQQFIQESGWTPKK